MPALAIQRDARGRFAAQQNKVIRKIPKIGKAAPAPKAEVIPIQKYYDPEYAAKYKIWPCESVAYAERDEFMKKLCGTYPCESTPIEDLIQKAGGYGPAHIKRETMLELYNLAKFYITHRNKQARLPKFSRWVSSMYQSNQDFNSALAHYAQETTNAQITVSDNMVDILRCADTPHYASCFGYPSQYPKTICEKSPGMAIAFINDPEGKMKGRAWLHHAKVDETGQEIVIVKADYGMLRTDMLCKALEEAGLVTYIRAAGNIKPVPTTFMNVDTQSGYDIPLNPSNQKVYGKWVPNQTNGYY